MNAFQVPMLMPAVFTAPVPSVSSEIPKSPATNVVSPGSASCRMPRKKYTVGKSIAPLNVARLVWAEAEPAAAPIVTANNTAMRKARIERNEVAVKCASKDAGMWGGAGRAGTAEDENVRQAPSAAPLREP